MLRPTIRYWTNSIGENFHGVYFEVESTGTLSGWDMPIIPGRWMDFIVVSFTASIDTWTNSKTTAYTVLDIFSGTLSDVHEVTVEVTQGEYIGVFGHDSTVPRAYWVDCDSYTSSTSVTGIYGKSIKCHLKLII